MNYIDLPLELSTKTIPQIKRMIATRIKRDIDAEAYNFKWDNYPFNEMRKYATKIEKNHKVIEDCYNWMQSVSTAFSPELWDQLIGELDALDLWSYDLLH